MKFNLRVKNGRKIERRNHSLKSIDIVSKAIVPNNSIEILKGIKIDVTDTIKLANLCNRNLDPHTTYRFRGPYTKPPTIHQFKLKSNHRQANKPAISPFPDGD